jgi:hypothetical protein
VQNGGFESDMSGWNVSGGDPGTSVTRVAGGRSGGHSARLANSNESAATCTLNDSPNWVRTTSAGTYVATLWVRADVAGQSLKFRVREFSGSSLLGTKTTDVRLTNEWQQVTVSHTITAAGASTLDLNAYVVKAAPGHCFDVDDVMIYLDPAAEPPPPPPPPALIANPGFESDLAGWNTAGGAADVTLARVAGGHSGDWAAQLVNPTGSPATCTLNDSPNWVKTTGSGTYTAGVWVRADAAGQTLKLRLREYSGSTLVGSATNEVALTSSWQRVSVDLAAGAPGSTLDLNAYVTKAPTGTCAYLDDASLAVG